MRNKLGLALKTALESVRVAPERADKFLCELANIPEYDHSPDGPNARRDSNGAIHVEPPKRVCEAWRRVFHLFSDLFPTRGNPIHERPNAFSAGTPGIAWVDPEYPDQAITDDIPPKLKHAWRLPTDTSRELFLANELTYYLRGPALCEAAAKAHMAQIQEQNRAEKEGATGMEAWSLGYERWSEVLRRESDDPSKLWAISEIDVFAEVIVRAIDVAPRMRQCSNPDCPAPLFIAARRSQRYCTDTCALPAQRESKRNWWSQHGRSYRGTRKKQTIGYHSK